MGTQRYIDMTFDLSYPTEHPKFLQRLGESTPTDIVVQVKNKGVDYSLAGVSLGFEMRNDNDKILIDTDQTRFTIVSASQGIFSYRPPEQMQSFFGNSYLAYFTFESGGTRITTERFRFYNDEDVQLAIAPELQEHYVSVIDDLITSNEGAMAKAEEIKNLIETNQVVKKVGDTMTGTLNGTSFTASGEIIFTNANTGRRTRLFMDNSNGTAWTVVTEKTAKAGDWDFTEHLRVGDRRNWLKNSGDSMTGELRLVRSANANYFRWFNGATQEFALGVGTGGTFELYDVQGSKTVFSYNPAVGSLLVNSDTNLMKKTDYTGKDGVATLTLSGSATIIDGITPTAIRRGNSVTVNIAAKRTTANNDVIVTLPVNYRPTKPLYKTITSTDGTASVLSIGTNGQVFFGDGTAGSPVQNKNFYMFETYVVD